MSFKHSLHRTLLATVLAVQAGAPAYAASKPYVRLNSSGGIGLGTSGGGKSSTDPGGTAGGTTNPAGGNAGGSTGGSTGGTGTNPTTGGGTTTNPTTGGTTTTSPTTGGGSTTPTNPGSITVKQTNTDGSTTVIQKDQNGSTSVTTYPSGDTTTIVKSGNDVKTTTTTPDGGRTTTAGSVGTISTPDTLSGHVNQPLTAQFATTSTGTPVWSFVDAAPFGLALNSRTGTLTGSVATVGTYPLTVTDGITNTAYPVNVTIFRALDIADAGLKLRIGVPVNAQYLPLNVIAGARTTVANLPTSLKVYSDGSVDGTPQGSDEIPATLSVTLHDTITTDPATGFVTKAFPVSFYPQPLTVTDYPDATIVVGVPVQIPAPTVGGNPLNPSFSLQGHLPSGLTLDPKTGAIAGIPTSAPASSQVATVTVTDDTGGSATTDPFHFNPSLSGVGTAATDYPVLAEDIYHEYDGSIHSIPYESYFSRSGEAPRGLFSGIMYTYARPVQADNTLDALASNGGTAYHLFYNASTNGGQDFQPVTGPVVASQFVVRPDDNGDYGQRTPVRARIGYQGVFPGWEPYLVPTELDPIVNEPVNIDLIQAVPPHDGVAPFTYLVKGLPKGVTFDGSHIISGKPTVSGNYVLQVTITDVAGIPSTSVPVKFNVQSKILASTAIPDAITDYSLQYSHPVGSLYANDPTYSMSDVPLVLDFPQYVRTDGSVSMNGDQPSSVLYDAGSGTEPYDQIDWEPVTGDVSAKRFKFVGQNATKSYARLGYKGVFPTFLPHLVDTSTSAMKATPGSTIDLTRAMPPVDGTGPFVYTISYGLPAGISFDGARTLTWTSAPIGDYFLHVTVSDVNGLVSPMHRLAVHVQSTVPASAVYPTSISANCCSGGPAINLLGAENNAVVGYAYGNTWWVTYAQPVTTDGTVSFQGGNSTSATVYATGTAAQAEDTGSLVYGNPFRTNYVSTPATPGAPVSGTSFMVVGNGPGSDIQRLRVGNNGVLPDFLPFMPNPASHNALQGGNIAIPLTAVMATLDVHGAPTFASPDGSLPSGTSISGDIMSGQFGVNGRSTTNLAVTDSRGIQSATQTLTLTSTDPNDPTVGGAYGIADYVDIPTQAGKPLASPPANLTGPWFSPRFTLSAPLPNGLAVNGDGSISGTLTSNLTSPLTYTMTATDAYGYNATTRTFHLFPYGYIAVSDATLNATYGEAFSDSLPRALNAVGNVSGVKWRIVTGTMPSGMALDVNSGALNGVPNVLGSFPMTIQATSVTGKVATANLTINTTFQAATFDGSSNYVTLPDIASTFFSGGGYTGFTMAGWVNFSATGSWQRIVELASGYGGGDRIFFTRHSTDNYLDGSVISGDANSGVPFNNGAWHYVAMEQSGNSTTLWMDGTNVGSGSQYTPNNVARPYSWLGLSSYGSDAKFVGQMADMQFYNRPLSAGELATTQGGASVAGLVGRYATGHNPAADLSGVGGNGIGNGKFAVTPFVPPFVPPPQPAAPGPTSDPDAAPVTGQYALTLPTYGDLIMTVGSPVAVPAPAVGGNPVNPRFSIDGASLPPGVNLNANGSITGTPSSLSTSVSRITLTVRDDRGLSATTKPFAMAATGVPIFNDTVLVADYNGGFPSDIRTLMSARQVNSATTWAVIDGSLPAGQTAAVYLATPQGGGGMTLNQDGSISGFASVTGKYVATIQATNLISGYSSSQTLTVFVPMIASHFDGASNALQIPSGTTQTFFDASGNFTGFTVAGWVNWDDQTQWERVFEFAQGSYGYNTMFLSRYSSNPSLSTYSSAATGGSVLPGNWAHVAVTRDTSGTETIYVNDVPVGSGYAGIPANVDRPLSFFGKSSYPDALFHGWMCDMVVANRPYSASEIGTLKSGHYVLGEVGRYLNGKDQAYDDSGSGQDLGAWSGPTLFQRFYPR